MHETTFTFSYRTPARAAIVAAALEPEVGAIDGDRTSVALDRREGVLQVTVEASDAVALRAGQNSWLGLLEVAEAVAEAGQRSDRD